MDPSKQSPRADVLTGAAFANALRAAAQAIERHAPAINALNVFPVPDGDTGTNLSLTAEAAVDASALSASPAIGDVAAAAAKGALMGARGNSGVIFSQILRGFARSLTAETEASPAQLAAALRAGSDAAYVAVTNPVEGTILTAARAAASAAEEAAQEGADVADTLFRAHRAATETVAHSPEVLPVLQAAGVVDSGAEGYRVFLHGFWSSLSGQAAEEGPLQVDVHADLSALHDEDDAYGYCTEVLFDGRGIDLAEVRSRLAAIGTSVLVVGDDSLVKIHVHTERPGRALNLATDLGDIVQVKVENIKIQRQALARTLAPREPDTICPRPGTTLIAVTAGQGFRELFTSLGAIVVTGARALNPSVEEILAAIAKAPRQDVIIVPNDPNAVLACQAAIASVEKRSIRIVATRDFPSGIAAALALNPEASLDRNVASIEEAVARCRVVTLTLSARSATVDNVVISRGQIFALVDGRVTSAGSTFGSVLIQALGSFVGEPHDLATVYVGAEGSMDEAQALRQILTDQLQIDVEVVDGGQPQHHYLIAVE